MTDKVRGLLSSISALLRRLAAIKNGAPSRAARQALKQRLFELRQKELRLMRQLGIRQPTGFRGAFCSSASTSAAMAVRAALERKQQQQQQNEPDPSGDGTRREKLSAMPTCLFTGWIEQWFVTATC
nr:unnamed protein product [Spirometra erinaceieuropaei]